MKQPPVSAQRVWQLGYHQVEAEAWLESSKAERSTTRLSYAAFELRLEAERVLFEFLVHVQGGPLSGADLKLIQSFKGMGDRVYELEGHQRIIDRKVEFWRLFDGELQLPHRSQGLNVGRIRSIWHRCSDLCHVHWTLLSARDPAASWSSLHPELEALARELREIGMAGIVWTRPRVPEVNALMDRFVAGEVSPDEVRAWIKEKGIWAQVKSADGRIEPIGAVPKPDHLKP